MNAAHAPASTAAAPALPKPRIVFKLRGGPAVAAKALQTLQRRHGLPSVRPLYVPRSRPPARFAVRARRAPAGAKVLDLSGTYLLDTTGKSAEERARIVARLRMDPAIEYAEEDQIAQASFVPNDPLLPELYGMTKIDAPAAWDTARGQGVVIAVVDTGVDFVHPDLDDNIWVNPGEIPDNGLDDDRNGKIDDWRGWDFVGPDLSYPAPDNDPSDDSTHGSHVSGTAAGEGNNGIGVVGVAWQAKVMSAKALDSLGRGYTSDLAAAVVYAADEGADVINASWGSPSESQTLNAAIDYVTGQGVVFVAAAGNANEDAYGFHPASHPRAITVSALDSQDQKAWFSNFGPAIEVGAPGVQILSLLSGNSEEYIYKDGTSMAAPHVSGVVALVLGRHPSFTIDQVRQVLRVSATDLGPTGKDPVYGYGRVNAAAAVAVDQVLEAKIASPTARTVINGPITVTGTAQGPGLVSWVLEYGAGDAPVGWTTITQSTTPVAAGTLGTFDTSPLPQGLYSLRLRVLDGTRTFVDQTVIRLLYVDLTSPRLAAFVQEDQMYKPETAIPVVGRATGPGFIRFRLEWAPGRDATTDFSTTGISLTGGGTSPVMDGTLGTWTPAPNMTGSHTLRLVVETSSVTTTIQTSVYLDPDLISAGFPHTTSFPVYGAESPIPVRQADGRTRLVTCGLAITPGCSSLGGDGSVQSVSLTEGGFASPAAGELDPTPGEEIVVADGEVLRILTAGLQPLRVIDPAGGAIFGDDMPALADLDGDGSLEIVAILRARDLETAHLVVYRSDGQPFGGAFPVTLDPTARVTPFLPVDLDGDRRKEILVYEERRPLEAPADYRLLAFRSDGSPYPAWTTTYFSPSYGAGPEVRLAAADLEHDGRPEIVVHQSDALRVLDATGAVRPGWPVTTIARNIDMASPAIGDLDRDGVDEIAVGEYLGLSVFRADGGEFGRWFWVSYGQTSRVVMADVDGDFFQDLVIGFSVEGTDDQGLPFGDQRLRAITRFGSVIKEWRLWGTGSSHSSPGVPLVADFNGDGTIDIGVQQSTGWNGLLRIFTSGVPFDPAKAAWPVVYGDAQISRSRVGASSTTIAPVADAYVRDGTSGGSNFGTATTLQVKTTTTAGNNRYTYLRFPLSAVASGVASAKLRLHGGRSQVTTATLAAFAVSSTTWGETTITWNNKPALGAKQADSVHITPTARYYEWDVTAFVKEQKAAGATAVSLAIKMDQNVNEAPDGFDSREAGENGPELVVTLVPPPPPVTVSASADAYVRDGSSAGTNFGGAANLDVKSTSSTGTNRISYLRFSLASVPATVGSARLRLHGQRPISTASTDAAFAVASNSWTEAGITWDNRPALGAKQGGSVTITPTAQYYEWDVTAFIAAQKAAGATAASLAVKMDQLVTDGPDTFSSREAATNPPQLVVSAP